MKNVSKYKVDKYWNSYICDPDFDGVSAMGGGGKIEIYYRIYFESKHFLEIIYKYSKPDILEVGCGSGRWGFSLSQYVGNYIGIDISKISILTAIKTCKLTNISNCKFYCIPISRFKTNKKFDIIYFSGVTQYMDDGEIANSIRKLRKHLKRDGIIIDRSTITLENKRYINDTKNYYSIYRTEEEITNIFIRLGFAKIYSRPSYRFLRLGKLISLANNSFVLSILRRYSLLSFNLLLIISKITDCVSPKVFSEKEIGRFTHKFQVYK